MGLPKAATGITGFDEITEGAAGRPAFADLRRPRLCVMASNGIK